MDAKDLLLDSFDRSATAYRETLQQARDTFSRKAVHDLRTSLRRLLSTLDVIAFFTSARRIEKLSPPLKEQLDSFSDLRDIQVMLDRVSADLERFPSLGSFQATLKKQKKRRQRSNEKHMEQVQAGKIGKQLQKIQKDVEDLSQDDVQDKFPQPVDEAYLTVVHRYGDIDPARLASIHQLRVAFKKFRYMVETIYPCLPAFPEAQLERMHEFQTQMGDIHDLQVLLETLNKRMDGRHAEDLSAARRFYEESLAERVSEFMANKDVLLSFWRATPLRAYPWQEEQKGKKS